LRSNELSCYGFVVEPSRPIPDLTVIEIQGDLVMTIACDHYVVELEAEEEKRL
jgi:hypothetical protein